jgi:hypothetical protein
MLALAVSVTVTPVADCLSWFAPPTTLGAGKAQ